MEEKKKHKVMIGIEVILLGMIIAIVGTNAASSNPPSNGVSYSKNSQTTVEGALNDLYNKANYGNASAGQILSGKTALVGGKKITGTIPNRMFTGNVTGGLNATYPNIALNVGGNTQLTTGTNGVEYIATSPPQGWYEGGGSSYTVIPKSTVISLYGITANKILKGQSIAGVAGTGETTCPSCPECKECPTPESQGYYKVYSFEDVEADIVSQYTTFVNGTWKRMSGTCNSSSGSYENGGSETKLCITLPFNPTDVFSQRVSLSGDYNGYNGTSWGDSFRISKGYKANSATEEYWYTSSISEDFVLTNSQTVSSSCTASTRVSYENNKLCYTINAPFYTRNSKFYLSGYVIYK